MEDKALKAILKQYKDTHVKVASQLLIKNLRPISTGSISLDLALGVPLPYGITEYAGGKGVGKTTLGLEATANAQKAGFKAHYFNNERSVNEKSFDGIDIDRDNLKVWYPESAEATLDIIEALIRTEKNCFIVLDSVAALVSEKIMVESASKEFMALTARLLSKWLPKAATLLERSESVLLLINQLRDNVGGYGSPVFTPGGKGKDFYSHEQVFFKTTKAARLTGVETDQYMGHMVTAEVVKNRFAPPFKKAEFPILYMPGPHIDRYREVAGLSVDLALVQKGGAWITLPDGETKVQGMDAYTNLLRDDDKLYESILSSLMEIIT
jgi:recombination protein RecA